MLTIMVPAQELFDEKTQTFTEIPAKELRLEHSLVSLSKWESKWKKPFLGKDEMTLEQTRDYVRCMTMTQNVSPMTYQCLSKKNIEDVKAYINDAMTATWFKNNGPVGGRGSVITAEILYWEMIELGIPFECQTWHLNRLLTLIRVCSEKQKPSKKMSKGATARQNRSLNAARRAKHRTRV